jgi:P-type Cu+ transporter
VDESAITGESLPQARAAGDRALGGALLVDGALHIKAQAVGEQTLLAHIAQAVAQAQARKASIQRVADQIAAVFVPIVVAIALLTLLGWWLAKRSLADALVPAVSVLVIACPCAVGLAVPIAMLTGATRAARAGVLIRGFEALERVRRIDTLVLDKTGTLTLGTPRLVAIHTNGISETDALSLATGLEQSVRHPLAEAILHAAQAHGIAPAPVEQVQVIAGGGVRAICTGEPQGAPPRAPTPLSHPVAGEGERQGAPPRAPTPLSHLVAGEGEPQGAPPCAPTPLSHLVAGEGEPQGAPPRAPTPLSHLVAGEGERQGAPPRAPTPLSHLVGEGTGVRAHTILLGSPRFLQDHGVDLDGSCEPPPAGSPCEQGEPIRLGSPREAGVTLRRGADTFPVLLAVDNRIVAGFEFADEPLPEVAETLRALRQAGLRLVLCSGDRPESVEAFAERVGIDEWHAAQLPHQKAEVVRRLQAEGRRVAFVGDGINDAPALAEADLGVVVATGTQLAAENADLILLNRDLRTLLTALRLSQAIYRVIRQNLFFAFVYNTLASRWQRWATSTRWSPRSP